jgi:hypothetical protein
LVDAETFNNLPYLNIEKYKIYLTHY